MMQNHLSEKAPLSLFPILYVVCNFTRTLDFFVNPSALQVRRDLVPWWEWAPPFTSHHAESSSWNDWSNPQQTLVYEGGLWRKGEESRQ